MLALRPFDASDDDVLISWVRTPQELLTFAGPELRWPMERAQLAAIRTRAASTAWTAVLEPGGERVGHVELLLTSRRGRGHIARVIIDPARRRSGLGRQMLLAVLDQAHARGINMLTLNVRRHNRAAIALYSGLGFKEIGPRPDDASVLSMSMRLEADTRPSASLSM